MYWGWDILNRNQSIDSKKYELVNTDINQISEFSSSTGVYSCRLNLENFSAGHDQRV